MVCAERFVTLVRIARDPENNDTAPLELREGVAKGAGFAAAARGLVLRIEVNDRRVASYVRETNRLPRSVAPLEIGSRHAWRQEPDAAVWTLHRPTAHEST